MSKISNQIGWPQILHFYLYATAISKKKELNDFDKSEMFTARRLGQNNSETTLFFALLTFSYKYLLEMTWGGLKRSPVNNKVWGSQEVSRSFSTKYEPTGEILCHRVQIALVKIERMKECIMIHSTCVLNCQQCPLPRVFIRYLVSELNLVSMEGSQLVQWVLPSEWGVNDMIHVH